MKQIHRIHYFRLNEGGILNKHYKNISKIPSMRKQLQEDKEYIITDEQLKQTPPGDLIKSQRDLSVDHMKDVLINRYNYGNYKLTRNSSVFYKNTNTAHELLLPKEKRTLNYYLNDNIIVKRLKEEKEKERRKYEFKKILLSDNEQMWEQNDSNNYSTQYLEEQLKIIQNYENQLMDNADLNKYDYIDSLQYIQDDNDDTINSFDMIDDSPVVLLQNNSNKQQHQHTHNNDPSLSDNQQSFSQHIEQEHIIKPNSTPAQELLQENEVIDEDKHEPEDNANTVALYQVIVQSKDANNAEKQEEKPQDNQKSNEILNDDSFSRRSETNHQETKKESDEDFD